MKLFFALYFLIEGWLLYRILWFSVIHQQESSTGSPIFPPSRKFIPSPSPSHPSSWSQSPVRVPWVIQLIPAGYLFYMWDCNRCLINNRLYSDLEAGSSMIKTEQVAGRWRSSPCVLRGHKGEQSLCGLFHKGPHVTQEGPTVMTKSPP